MNVDSMKKNFICNGNKLGKHIKKHLDLKEDGIKSLIDKSLNKKTKNDN